MQDLFSRCRIKVTAASKRGGSHLKLREWLPQFEAEIRNTIPSKKFKSSLSLENENLRAYFSELKPQAKRESEERAYQGLRVDYSEADIAECFQIVRKKGIGQEGQPCHSPMAFLSKAIGAVLTKVQETRAKARQRIEREEAIAREKREQAEQAAREADEWSKKEQAFHRTFSSEERRREVLAELCRGLPFRPDSEAGRVLAIGRWWEGMGRVERVELCEGGGR